MTTIAGRGGMMSVALLCSHVAKAAGARHVIGVDRGGGVQAFADRHSGVVYHRLQYPDRLLAVTATQADRQR